ncbi:hypothetical protein CRENBAI_007054 [Crenichthys baileyi]|uniref:Uncharacterized protein n=1 Tax=Crenichthys baileyi TaxID=28760 RepID=A0AAV9RZS3_9TELE
MMFSRSLRIMKGYEIIPVICGLLNPKTGAGFPGQPAICRRSPSPVWTHQHLIGWNTVWVVQLSGQWDQGKWPSMYRQASPPLPPSHPDGLLFSCATRRRFQPGQMFNTGDNMFAPHRCLPRLPVTPATQSTPVKVC